MHTALDSLLQNVDQSPSVFYFISFYFWTFFPPSSVPPLLFRCTSLWLVIKVGTLLVCLCLLFINLFYLQRMLLFGKHYPCVITWAEMHWNAIVTDCNLQVWAMQSFRSNFWRWNKCPEIFMQEDQMDFQNKIRISVRKSSDLWAFFARLFSVNGFINWRTVDTTVFKLNLI